MSSSLTEKTICCGVWRGGGGGQIVSKGSWLFKFKFKNIPIKSVGGWSEVLVSFDEGGDVNSGYEGGAKRERCYCGERVGDINRGVGVRNYLFVEIL